MLAPLDLDPRAIALQFDRRAAQFERNDYLLREIENRMLSRLEVVKIEPAQILDLGCGIGAGVAALGRRYPRAQVLGVDLSPKMISAAARKVLPSPGGLFSRFLNSVGAGVPSKLSFQVADLAQLPLPDQSVDLLCSNLAFHWLIQPEAALKDMYRVAKPGALLMFSAFGVDTLKELRPANAPRNHPAPGGLMPFRDMHDWGDALVEVGFSEPVMDMERITLSFAKPESLLKDLHFLAGNALRSRFPTLSPRSLKSDLLVQLINKQAEGRELTLTFEVFYGHAWVAAKKRRTDGLPTIDFLPKPPRRSGPAAPN